MSFLSIFKRKKKKEQPRKISYGSSYSQYQNTNPGILDLSIPMLVSDNANNCQPDTKDNFDGFGGGSFSGAGAGGSWNDDSDNNRSNDNSSSSYDSGNSDSGSSYDSGSDSGSGSTND